MDADDADWTDVRGFSTPSLAFTPKMFGKWKPGRASLLALSKKHGPVADTAGASETVGRRQD